MTSTHVHRELQNQKPKAHSTMNLDEMPDLIARVLLNDRQSAKAARITGSVQKRSALNSTSTRIRF